MKKRFYTKKHKNDYEHFWSVYDDKEKNKNIRKANFFSAKDAREYAEWLNEKEKP